MPVVRLHLVEGGIDESDAGILLQFVAVALVEVPVEAVKGAGFVAVFFGFGVMAGLTVIRHLVDVVGGGNVGLGAHEAAIGILAHAAGVGDFDPFDGVDVDAKVPLIQFVGVDTRQQGEVPRDHQPLYVMGVGIIQGIADRVVEAVHFRVASPVPFGQFSVVAKEIFLRVLGHVRPVHPAHVFAPADDLPYKALNLRNVNFVLMLLPVRHCSTGYIERMQDLGVDGKGNPRVKQRPVVFAQRILIGAKVGQAFLQKELQSLFRFLSGGGP